MWAFWVLLAWLAVCYAANDSSPLDIIGIGPTYYDTLENNARPFGFQNAYYSSYNASDDTLSLFEDACVLRNGTRDCTAACTDNTQMFGNLETLHNCMSYPRIAVQMANNNLTDRASSLARALNIEANNASGLPSRISNSIQRCLLDTCKAVPECREGMNMIELSDEDQGPTGFNTTENHYFVLCADIPAYLNADVGGVGVNSNISMMLNDC